MSTDDGEDHAIHDSIIVEFDTWKNYSTTAEQVDPNDSGYDNHVAIMLDGNNVHSEQSDVRLCENGIKIIALNYLKKYKQVI